MSSADVLQALSEGDRVLYNTKQQPLTVKTAADETVTVVGPQGGEYLLFLAPDNPELVLESRSGNREYASKVTDLRIVGVWEQETENRWVHSQSGATVELVKTDTGHWTLIIQDFAGEQPDIPRYGFLTRKHAKEAASNFIEKNPEG